MTTYLSTPQAAQYLADRGVIFTEKTLCVWRCLGRGPRFIKLARKVFYRLDDLDAFIETACVVDTIDSHEMA